MFNEREIEVFINECCDNIDYSGNIQIRKGNTVLYERTSLFSDFSSGDKMQLNTVFELASISKTFVSFLIEKLTLEKRVNLDDRVSKYVPLNQEYTNITIGDLLRHTSGLLDYEPLFAQYWQKNKIANNNNLIEYLNLFSSNLLIKNSQSYHYSNTNYALLVSVLENLFNCTFKSILTSQILERYNLSSTFLKESFYFEKNQAKGHIYSIKDRAFIEHSSLADCQELKYLSGIIGDTGINSNIEDIFKWVDVLRKNFDSQFLTSSFTQYPKSKYEMGWNLHVDSVLGKIVFHLGSWFGYKLFIRRYLDLDITVVVMRNNGFFFLSNIMKGIDDILRCGFTKSPNSCIAYEIIKQFDEKNITGIKSLLPFNLEIDKRDFREMEFVVRNTSKKSKPEYLDILNYLKKYVKADYVL